MKYIAKNLAKPSDSSVARHIVCVSREETQKIAGDFVKNLLCQRDTLTLGERATIVGLYGELGAGKTSFTQGVALALGISETVVSPTFVIMKIYELQNLDLSGQDSGHDRSRFQHLIHIDAYRLEKSSELRHLGWQKIISDPKNLILIEWPERVSDIMPEHIHINFSHTTDGCREIKIQG